MSLHPKIRRYLLAVIFALGCIELTTPGSSIGKISVGDKDNMLYSKPRTYEDYYVEKAAHLTKLDDITLYVLAVCKREQVDPLEMLAILEVENPLHKKTAVNINYKRVWSKKHKRYVKVEASRDEGVFQLNSACRDTFEWFYWTQRGETEAFDPMNYKHNVRLAVRLHKANKKQFNGSLYYAVLSYNAGSGNVTRGTVAERTVKEYWPLFKKHYAKLRGGE